MVTQLDKFCRKQHQQKLSSHLADFNCSALRGWVVLVNPLKKRKICDENLFQINVE